MESLIKSGEYQSKLNRKRQIIIDRDTGYFKLILEYLQGQEKTVLGRIERMDDEFDLVLFFGIITKERFLKNQKLQTSSQHTPSVCSSHVRSTATTATISCLCGIRGSNGLSRCAETCLCHFIVIAIATIGRHQCAERGRSEAGGEEKGTERRSEFSGDDSNAT